MSQYGLIYRMEFKNIEGFTVRADIIPTDILIADDQTPAIIDLTPGAAPVVISASNNDENKYTPIRSKSVQLQFVTDTGSGLDSSTFSQGADDLWLVNIYLQDTPELIFTGFLMMADNQQPFQPDPQYVTLTATDHLAAIKEAAWVDLDGENPIGKYRVADIINFCLRKTGLTLPFNVVNNLRIGSGQTAIDFANFSNASSTIFFPASFYYKFTPGQQIVVTGTSLNNTTFTVLENNSGANLLVTPAPVAESGVTTAVFTDPVSASHWYDIVYIDAKTFEKEIGLSQDCYTVLSKILGEDCYITQWKGEWWIMRVDEMEDNPTYVAEFDSDGVYVATTTLDTNYSVGFTEDSKFANADTLLRYIRPHDFIKETFNYDTPLEVPCNKTFARGDLVDGSNPLLKSYNLDCWGKFRENYPTSGLIPATVTILTYKAFNQFDRETDKYVNIPYAAVSSNLIYSDDIPVNVKDRFVIGMSRRLNSDVSGSGFYRDNAMQVRLTGDDGTYWTLQGETSTGDTLEWVASNSDFTINNKYFWFEGDVSRDMTEPESIYGDTEAPPVPVAGIINLLAHQTHQASWNRDTYILSISFEYVPYIAGSYREITGQYSQVDRTADGYLPNRDNEVFISDSPAPIFKGGLFYETDAGPFKLIQNWFAAAPFGNSYPPNQDYLHPYGYIQAFSVWNQYKGVNVTLPGGQIRGKGINIFEGSVYGLTDVWPDLLYKFSLTDANTQTNDRYFMLISLTQDWKSCIWTATFIEVYNRVIYKTYDDPFIFKYLTE